MSGFPLAELLWWVFASLAISGGLGMVFSRNPIGSLLFLVLSFFSLAAIYVLLQAHFVAAIQVIVYAGAIMVLFLFVIMLLNLGHDYHADVRNALWVAVAAAAAGVIGFALYDTFAAPGGLASIGGGEVIDASVRDLNAVGAIAMPLFQDYLVPFELTGILLLVAVVGAALIAKRRV
jgi:NADH-quinone oxidoreductase subunit J